MKERLSIPSGSDGFAFCARAPMVRLPPHHHEELEVNLVLSGRAAYLFGNERVALEGGSMIWLFPDQEHVLIDCSRDFSIWVLVFSPGCVVAHARSPERRMLKTRDPGSILCRQIPQRELGRLDGIYRHVVEGMEAKDYEFSNAALAHALVASWQSFGFSRDDIVLTDVHPAVSKAVQILSVAQDPLPLPELARKSGLSAARLSRLFKKQTGTSLTAFRQRKCVERFLKIYRQGARHSLTEAAFLAGFGSYPQFHRVFKNCLGQTPAAYAAAMKKSTL